ncbi:MAG: NAD-dependent epimerase/dehydratase family protein [Gammaproteobacteria bacterium]|nr:NAD-dependent epimerase/dehydratase family protein [Gammaproteobacteria bacterium]
MSDSRKIALVIGCGYTGTRLAHRLIERGLRVVGVARRAEHNPELKCAGIEPMPGDLAEADFLSALGELSPSVVAYLAPPLRAADPLPAVLTATSGPLLEAFLYASSSSVYGDCGGEWVDETTPISSHSTGDPDRYAAERCVAAAAAHGIPARVCRITGIYGPGRSLRHPLANGDYTLIEGCDPWVNRIHVDDLVAGFIAAWERGNSGMVYNMVDEQPHRASEFADLAADLNHLPRPVRISEIEARTRYDAAELRRKLSSKRVRCLRLTNELGVILKYPGFRTGLAAAVAQER